MEAKHTPGPWLWKNGGDGKCLLVGADGTEIISATGLDGKEHDDCLIEAAPDLLEALKIVTNDLACLVEKAGRQAALDPRIKMARAAIAKAQPQEGEE